MSVGGFGSDSSSPTIECFPTCCLWHLTKYVNIYFFVVASAVFTDVRNDNHLSFVDICC